MWNNKMGEACSAYGERRGGAYTVLWLRNLRERVYLGTQA
jgi:hypothetical protein